MTVNHPATTPAMDAKQVQLVKDYKLTFDTPHGQRVLENLMMLCGAHCTQDMFDRQSEHNTSYNLGKNRVYRHIQTMLQTDTGKEAGDCITEENGE